MSKRNATSFLVDKAIWPGKPGAIVIRRHWEEARKDEIVGIEHACPCGCGIWSWMPFKGYGFAHFWEPQPTAADDLTKLTLAPSIGIKGTDYAPGNDYHWHGYLKAGVFEEC